MEYYTIFLYMYKVGCGNSCHFYSGYLRIFQIIQTIAGFRIRSDILNMHNEIDGYCWGVENRLNKVLISN